MIVGRRHFCGCVICGGCGRLRPGAAAQTTFQNYHCADGTQFIAGFFQYNSRAHLQLDGKAVTLIKRLALSGFALFRQRRDLEDHEGRRHHAQARQTAGDGLRADMKVDMKKGRNIFVSTLFYCPNSARRFADAALQHLADISDLVPAWLLRWPRRDTSYRCNQP